MLILADADVKPTEWVSQGKDAMSPCSRFQGPPPSVTQLIPPLTRNLRSVLVPQLMAS